MIIGNSLMFAYGLTQRFIYLLPKRNTKVKKDVTGKIACLIVSKYGQFNRGILSKLNGYDVFVVTNNKEYKDNKVNVFVTEGAKSKGESINRWLNKYGKDYDFVAIFDEDSDIEKNWFNKMLKYFYDDKVAFVQSPSKATSGLFKRGVYSFFRSRIPDYFLACGHNIIFRTKPLIEVGGFAHSLGEDFITSIKLFSKGYKSVLCRDCISYEENPRSLKEFVLRDMKWSVMEETYIKNLGKVWKTKMPFMKKLEITFDFLRGFMAFLIMLLIPLLLVHRVNQTLFFVVYLLFGLIPFVPETILLAPALIIPTGLGFFLGLFSKPREFIATSEIKHNMKKERITLYTLYLLLIGAFTYNIIRGFNIYVSGFMLFSFILSIIMIVR